MHAEGFLDDLNLDFDGDVEDVDVDDLIRNHVFESSPLFPTFPRSANVVDEPLHDDAAAASSSSLSPIPPPRHRRSMPFVSLPAAVSSDRERSPPNFPLEIDVGTPEPRNLQTTTSFQPSTLQPTITAGRQIDAQSTSPQQQPPQSQQQQLQPQRDQQPQRSQCSSSPQPQQQQQRASPESSSSRPGSESSSTSLRRNFLNFISRRIGGGRSSRQSGRQSSTSNEADSSTTDAAAEAADASVSETFKGASTMTSNGVGQEDTDADGRVNSQVHGKKCTMAVRLSGEGINVLFNMSIRL